MNQKKIKLNWAGKDKEDMQHQLRDVGHSKVAKEAQARVLIMLSDVFPPALTQVKNLFSASASGDNGRIRGCYRTVRRMACLHRGSYIGTALAAALKAATPPEGAEFDPYDREIHTFCAKGELATAFRLLHDVYIQKGISTAPIEIDQFEIEF